MVSINEKKKERASRTGEHCIDFDFDSSSLLRTGFVIASRISPSI